MAESFGGSLEEFLRMLAAWHAQEERHGSDDPADYDRAAQVTDDGALMLVAAFYRKQEELGDAAEACRTLAAELEAAKGRMFAKLGKLHPDVKRESDHSGVRRKKAGRVTEVYYVGWDD